MTRFTFRKTQLSSGDEVFFDHVAWMVADMDRASEAFERLGFILTPYSEHANTDSKTGVRTVQGTANRLAMLETGYIELLTNVKGVDNPLTANFRGSLGRYEGVHLLAFGIDDPEGAHARIAAAGIPVQPLVNLRRDVEAADGSAAEVAFTVLRTGFDAFPEGRMQLLKHLTRDHMWQDRYFARANGVVGLHMAVVCVADPAEAAGRLGTLLGIRPTPAEDGDVAVACVRGGVLFVSPATLDRAVPGAKAPSLPYVAAIGFVADDLEKSRGYFAKAGVPTVDNGERIVVPAAEALGTAMIIQAV